MIIKRELCTVLHKNIEIVPKLSSNTRLTVRVSLDKSVINICRWNARL